MRMFIEGLSWLRGLPQIPEFDLSVVASGHEEIAIVWVDIYVSHYLRMSLLDFEGRRFAGGVRPLR